MENSLKQIFKKICGDQSGEFLCGYWAGGGVGTLYSGLYREAFIGVPLAGFRYMKE